MSNKEKGNEKGILGIRKSAHSQFRPFGRHAEAYPSDDSDDSDYEPTTRGPDNDEQQSSNSPTTEHGNKAKLPSVVSKRLEGSVNSVKKAKTTAVEGSKIGCNVDVTCLVRGSSTKAWSEIVPSEILLTIFIYCVQSQGPIPLLSR